MLNMLKTRECKAVVTKTTGSGRYRLDAASRIAVIETSSKCALEGALIYYTLD